MLSSACEAGHPEKGRQVYPEGRIGKQSCLNKEAGAKAELTCGYKTWSLQATG